MDEPAGDIPLPLSRPLGPDALPVRSTLRLADGYETSVYFYAPHAGVPWRTPVVYLHGIQSHPGWFCGSAAALARQGWPVFQVTRRGSGDNESDRGHAASAGQLLDDIATACRHAVSASSPPHPQAETLEGATQHSTPPMKALESIPQDSTPPIYLAPGPASGPGAHAQPQAGPNSSSWTPPHPQARTLEGATQSAGGQGTGGPGAWAPPHPQAKTLEGATQPLARQDANRSVHLLGVSWGGKLAAAFAARPPHDVQLASLVLVAPGLAARVDLPAFTKLAVALCAVCRPRRGFDIPLNEVELFTDNEAMRAYLRADPRRLRRATARFLAVTRMLDLALARTPDGALTLPTTLLLAERDRIVDNGRTRRIVQRLTAGRAEIEAFDAAHTLEFEPDPEPFYNALAAALARAE